MAIPFPFPVNQQCKLASGRSFGPQAAGKLLPGPLWHSCCFLTHPTWRNADPNRRRTQGMKDQKKIRLGLIGVGNWALFAHVRVLRLLPEYEIVAIYSQRNEAAKAAATEYGIPHVAES